MSARRKRGRYRRFRLGLAERAVKQPVPAIQPDLEHSR